VRFVSSRISPFGTLGDRVAASRGDAAGKDAAMARDDRIEVRPVERGVWVEYQHESLGWLPGLLVAWQRHSGGGAWWARIVVVAEPGVAVEMLVAGHLVRQPGTPTVR
jgi:hypothetical protein